LQTQYLAESAANHAMWRMLNDPAFAPAADTYYMHSFANGRYGYKVRKPTATTFATVATVGAIGDIVTHQSYVQYVIPSNVLAAYPRITTPTVQYRRLIGAIWTDPVNTLDIPVPTVTWVEMAGCPVRKEIIMGTVDGQFDINLAVWDGASWGHPHVFTTEDVSYTYKRFDVAYESQSGRALVVGRYDNTTTVRYNIWDGTAWLHAAPQPAFDLASGEARLVVMAACPGNDHILIGVVNSSLALQLFRWDGTAFTDLSVLETNMAAYQYGYVQIVYEQQSGDALVIWSRWGDTAFFRVWDGAALGPELTVSGFDQDVEFLRAAPDPASDQILLAGADKFTDLWVLRWDGDSWVDAREVDTSILQNNIQTFDIAWEPTGDQALVAWSSFGDYQLYYLPWQKGTPLAAAPITAGPNFQNVPRLLRLLPMAQSEKIIVLARNNAGQLCYSLWDGDLMRGDPASLVEPDIATANSMAFDLAEANVPRTGGTGTAGGGGNLAPVVDAGPDQTIYLPTNEANLDGTVTDDGLPNPPATVDTTWIKVSGPGTVTFDDPSLVDTVARFSDAGEYVLKLTADDSELSAFDEVTIIVDAGCTEQLLYVVKDSTILTSQESERRKLMVNWGWTVTLIDDDDTQANFDAAAAANDVAYISQEAVATTLGSKLNDTPIGVVNENKDMLDDFGFSTGLSMGGGLPTLNVDPDHYITSAFGTSPVAPYVANEWYQIVDEPVAAGVDAVGTWVEVPWTGKPALMALSQGALLIGGGTAAGRRVQIPWGSGQGATPVDINSLSGAGRGLIKRSIEWAGGCDGCNADYMPDIKIGGFSTASYGSNDTQSITYFPEGMAFNGVTAPAGGAWISVDTTNDLFYMTDMSGNFLTSVPTATASTKGVTLVTSGSFVNHLATVDNGSNTLTYVDLDGNAAAQLLLSTHGIGQVAGVGFIETTVSGTYDGHLAVVDRTTESVYVVTQGGTLKTTIDVNDGTADAVQDVGHLPGTDKIILPYLHEVRIYDLSGTLVRQYDTTTFGATDLESVVIYPNNCDHVVADKGVDMVMYLNTGGGGGGASDTDPPTPDPMTWASPPTAVDQSSITMTATTASDPSGVDYSFECTAGGGNHSGWQAGTTYVDSGLSPETQYTYRVKARDRSSNQNETGWSPEASATTLSNEMYVYDITMGYRKHATKRWGQATVWIKGVGGADISGAVVSGDWSGDVIGTSMGATGSDGKVMLESPEKKEGVTFTFTVTSVVKAGYIYNPSLNVETSDTIIVP
jgi:hypothetical protein